MNHTILSLPSFTITGIKQEMDTSEAFELIPMLWQTASENGIIPTLLGMIDMEATPPGLLGVAANGHWEEKKKMDYYLAITTNQLPETTIPLSQLTLPAATWIVIEAHGELPSAVQDVYTTFYSQWLPQSNYQVADLPVIESYQQNNQQHVWIAITS